MSLLVLGLWTLFVWATRIGTVLADDELTAAGKAGRLALVASFVAVAAVALWGWWRARRGQRLTGRLATAVRIAAWWTIAVWVVRGIQIALAGHEATFVIVHTVLALVSIGLGLWVLRSGTLPTRHGTTGDRRPEAHVA